MDALGELAGRLEEVRLERGEPLWTPGERAFGFYVVCSGDVHLGGGPWREGDHLGPGSVPGLMATLSRRTYEYRAVASEPTVLLLAPSGPFFDVLQDHFEFAYEMLGAIARNLLEAGSRVAGVGSSVAEDGGSGRSTW
jgi:CRP-like cAMP-binding protein